MGAWSYQRQGLDKSWEQPLDALKNVVSVYSSNPSAPLSLLSRTESLSPESFSHLEKQRHAVRLPAMRGSIFLMPTESAPKLLAATAIPMKQLARRLEYGGYDWNDYERLRPKILEVASEPVSTAELQESVPTDGKLMVLVRVMAYEGLILRIGTGLRSDIFRYVAAEKWLGAPLPRSDPDESLRWLASEYLTAFGPARIADFVWWAGVTKRRAAEAIQAVPTVEIASGLLLAERDMSVFEQQQAVGADSVAIIPKWDAYTMAYPADGRSRFIADEYQPIAYARLSATTGDGLPLVLHGGKAVATWGHRFQGNIMEITVNPFDPTDGVDWLDAHVFGPMAELLGAEGVQVTVGQRA